MAKKLTTEQFIINVKKVHGDFYGYDRTIYKGKDYKVEIYCPVCEKYFWKIANNHRNGQGCPICGRKISHRAKVLTTKQFIEDSKKIHGNKYDYSETIYKRSNQKVKIYCNTCKEYFYQVPNSHKQGHGCNICGNKIISEKLKLTQKEFISRSKEIHGNKYNYSEVKYKNATKKIKIYCNQCNEYFMQSPVHHLEGKGHKKCCSDCFSPTKYGKAYPKAILYIIHCWGMDEAFYKIGITSNGIRKRFRYLEDYQYEIWYEKELSGYDARAIEIKLHSLHKKYKHIPYTKFNGSTECFSYIDFNKVKETLKDINVVN